jgi:hypothetical protein
MSFSWLHICPTEIAAIMMMLDTIKVYTYHYKHIIASFFVRHNNSKTNQTDCIVCTGEYDGY